MTQANNVAIESSQINSAGVLQPAGGGTGTASGVTDFKNRIINGAMVIAQYGTGSFTPTVTGAFDYGTCDRWANEVSVASKFTVQQNQGSVTPPVGFTNYLGMTSSSSYSSAAGDYFTLRQGIEGFNIADLGWGTANAKTVTMSFWVYSSLTGTFGGALANSTQGYSYPFSYSIPVANTWTYVSVTVPGPTGGAWLTNNNVGINVQFDLGSGSNYKSSPGVWSAAVYLGVTGGQSIVGTNGATFYITGVQLEVGSSATNFAYRSIGTELALCQRYYQNLLYNGGIISIRQYVSNVQRWFTPLQTQMRAIPTISYVFSAALNLQTNNTSANTNGITWDIQYTSGGTGVIDIGNATTFTLSAEL